MAACTACTVAALTSTFTEGALDGAPSAEGAVTLGGGADSPAAVLVAALADAASTAFAGASVVTMVATRGLPEPSTV